ncbi:S-methyl-5-thioribose-1-phosphate isomerase [Carboxylicivirga sp. N1Y90]|uniref:S-methyl-5-thioribose-1-phosphate isomerase n=1 Tax=Carboxylicivirga fragile TaxID=3417571 RepID=UPI003D345BF0|nr:S-methyl-5-thioribose-1-phosphate isomerase [Marinilabiliaceae bacterium N1Y90]
MIVQGKHYKTVWFESASNIVYMIDQTQLPFKFEIVELHSFEETAEAIRNMTVRGAGAIGASAAFAMAQAFIQSKKSSASDLVWEARKFIEATRPTAVNLFYATQKVFDAGIKSIDEGVEMAFAIAHEDEDFCKALGEHGNTLIKPQQRILTHCNAGWLAFVDYGSAISPIYAAHRDGKKPFVYVDETRPRGQGARLTAWELNENGVEHRIIADNAAAYYMSKGMIDMVITGADRIASNGDTANKIGTLEKAILAKEFNIPFYVAAPFSTIDFDSKSGASFNIEERSDEELLYHDGLDEQGVKRTIRMASPGSLGLNPAFDVTPHNYIKGFITNKGILAPSQIIKFE